MIKRRQFIAGSACAVPLAVVGGSLVAQDENPPLESQLVGEFVGKSHFDLDAVKSMAKQEPALVLASWDWGNGDWETGLGAAAHTGRRPIAEFLLEQGARIDTFAAAMLGLTPVVKSLLVAYPNIHQVRGPHEIPLLSHAVVGRQQADEVFHLLLESGADLNATSRIGLTPLIMAAITGRVEIIRTLLDRGADATHTDDKGKTALDWATDRKNEAAIKLLSEINTNR